MAEDDEDGCDQRTYAAQDCTDDCLQMTTAAYVTGLQIRTKSPLFVRPIGRTCSFTEEVWIVFAVMLFAYGELANHFIELLDECSPDEHLTNKLSIQN